MNNELFAPNFWGVLRAWIESDRMWWESNEAYGMRRFGGGLLYEAVDNVHVVGTYLLNKFIHGEGYGEHLDNTQGIEWGGNDMVVRAGNVGALLMSPGASRGSVLIDDVAKTTNRPFAMGIEDYLDDFARQHNAMTWKEFDDAVNWQPQVLEKLSDPKTKVIFNLDGVDVYQGVQRAASGRGGATDWELLQIRGNPSYWNTLEFYLDGRVVLNPFR